ncbi:Lsr2 family protein [Propionimicrobium lymphophilum]|uniref:Lsr2 family protein n=1 Tax=Propionimicrobium lymphophilum ACS-093-V-SCH5 TaxID=883161 RepID=S2VZQ2_9ACTN|nr:MULTISPECIES: Lsr2 family protein [Propionimicrobium]EPD32346.1 hypothetical protein HMPREF9306_01915 [Propionimicrobium lymphophilum ACS-093-V-SCH5]ETJ97180.1 hypothetical protein HMPREF1255_0925 [Propionimicrobium sp. BV2F7]MDK7709423.1 Lsr2 family protein [Propionimicrobium lymphophilum]MDK7733409.1 Lsr2 family protein [Propionimicrobium lymphophilum]
MARKTQVLLIDDLDGVTEADETVSFSLDGVNYEIDLVKENADRLREGLNEWVAKARRVGGRRSTGRRSVQDGPAASDIRKWATENGYDVSPRGRVPSEVREAYEKANGGAE